MFGFDFSWLDPNLAYVLLLGGLWLGVIAIYIAGTGVPEFSALAMILGALFVLSAMPTNWAAVGLMVFGAASFLLMPLFGEKWGRYAEFGLVFQGFGAYFLFHSGLQVSPLLIGATLLFGIFFYRKVLVPTLRNQSKSMTVELVGTQGRVVKDLDPVGTVYVQKELWRARSAEPLSKDTMVVVVAQDGLELTVEKAKN
jgi:membrane-bound serine protease (ClpP class)